MLHKVTLLMATAAIVSVTVAANAADVCFRYENGGGTLVPPGFILLDDIFGNRNLCAPFNAYESATAGLWGALTATGCISSNGNAFILHYSYHNLNGFYPISSYFESGTCRFRIRSLNWTLLNGFCRGTVITGTSQQSAMINNFSLPANVTKCSREVEWLR